MAVDIVNNTTPIKNLVQEAKTRAPESLDFTDRSPEGVLRVVEGLKRAASAFNSFAVREFGGKAGPERQEGLLEMSIGAAFQSFGGIDPHPNSFEKAAMLLRGVTQGHPFFDGNKRTGFLLTAYYLEQTGVSTPEDLPDEEAYDLCMKVSAGEIRDVGVMAQHLLQLWNQSEKKLQ